MAAFPGQTALDTVHTRSKQKGEKMFFFLRCFFILCVSLSLFSECLGQLTSAISLPVDTNFPQQSSAPAYGK